MKVEIVDGRIADIKDGLHSQMKTQRADGEQY